MDPGFWTAQWEGPGLGQAAGRAGAGVLDMHVERLRVKLAK